jgi:YesN/AraC family two-component response regulator
MSKENILIVDDEVEIREMLARHFEFDDYTVFQAEDGKAALEVLSTVKIDVVISDIVMPRMTGVELLEILSNEYPMTRAIMITGYVTQNHLLKCMQFHAETVVFKPIEDLTELDDAVKNCLKHLQQWKDKFKALQGLKG